MWNLIMAVITLQMWSEPHVSNSRGWCYNISTEIKHKVARYYSVTGALKPLIYRKDYLTKNKSTLCVII
jgi:hypothetical protein